MIPVSSLSFRRYRNKILAILFIVPALCVFGMFAWYPIILGLTLGFHKVELGMGNTWIGLQNFKAVLSDSLLRQAIFNTLEFVLLALMFGYLVPVIVAIALTEVRRFRSFFRLTIYMPNIIPAIALYIMWNWLFDPAVGLLNTILKALHLPTLQWLLSPATAIPSLIIMATWAGFGGTAILYMAAITGFPEELYEASEIDGASVLQRVRYITIPQLKPVMLIMLILQILGTFQVFQEPFVMTGGGPNNATLTIMFLVYRYAFVYFDFGKAGALGALFFIFLAFLSIIYFRLSRRAEA
ncbi:MAG TPA: sugar ABC transporter permease [Firmicutes bacterium]|nr:sugar ABC transporter permease [Bacillota bacterium]